MKKSALRVLVTVLALCVALGPLGVALAVPVYGEGGDSYIRSKPSLSGAQLGLFPDGATAEYLNQSAEDSRGVTWYKISYGGRTGWVSSRYTTLSGETVGARGYKPVWAVGGDSYIRSEPELSGDQLGLFPEGASASYLGSSAQDDRGVTWYYISYGGTDGWVSSRYTSFSADFYDTIYGDGGDSYIRSQPNLSGAQLGLLPEGASAAYLGSSSVDSRGVAWYRISYEGITGWVSSRYTTFDGGYAGSTLRDGDFYFDTVYASGGDSYIRSEPNLSGAQLALFPEGAYATYLNRSSVDGRGVAWYRVSYNGTTGWVSSRYTYLE